MLVIVYTTISDHGDREFLITSVAGGNRGNMQVSK